MTLQSHPGVVMKPAAVAEWRHEAREDGIAVIVDGKAWPSAEWREFARLWISGADLAGVQMIFLRRGYLARDIESLSALIVCSPHMLPPVDRALFCLGGVARRDESAPGGFTIHQRPARAIDIVRCANRVLATLALPQIHYPNGGAR